MSGPLDPLDLGRFSVHTQWGPRPSTVDDTGRLLTSLLRLTADTDPRITAWFPADNERTGFTCTDPAALTRLAQEHSDGDPPMLRLQLESTDVNGTGAPDTELDLAIGATDRFEPNHITWTLHEAGPQVLASPTASQSLLRALVILTDCDWAAISSTDIDRWQAADADSPTIGWSTYLAYRLLPTGPSELPGVAVEPVHRGYLITTASRPELTDRSAVLAVASGVMRHRRPAGRVGVDDKHGPTTVPRIIP